MWSFVIEFMVWRHTKTLMSLRQGVDRAWYTTASQPFPSPRSQADQRTFRKVTAYGQFRQSMFFPEPLWRQLPKSQQLLIWAYLPTSSRGHWLHSVQPRFSCYLLPKWSSITLFLSPIAFQISFSPGLQLTWSFECIVSSPERPG